MIVFIRQLTLKYSGGDEFCPANISRDKTYQVVGERSRLRDQTFNNAIKKMEDVFFLVIGDDKKLSEVSSINCTVEINRSAEFNHDKILQSIGTIQSLLGQLSERFKNEKTEG